MFAKRLLTAKSLTSMTLVLLATLLSTVFWSQSVSAQSAVVEPTGLTVQSGDGRLDISWTAPSGAVTGYEVQYRLSGLPDQITHNYINGWEPRTHTGTGTTHAITGMTNGDYREGRFYYDVRVRAVNGAAKSAWVQGKGSPAGAATKLMLMGPSERELRDGNFIGRLRGGFGMDGRSAVAETSFIEYVDEYQSSFAVTAQLDGIAPSGGYTVTLKVSGAGTDALTLPDPFQIPEGETRAEAYITIADDSVSELTKYFTLSATVSPSSIPVQNVDGHTYDGRMILCAVLDNDQDNWRPPFDLDSLMANGVKFPDPIYDGHRRLSPMTLMSSG